MAGDILSEISIAIANERTTVEEIIRERVSYEVGEYNKKLGKHFTGLVQSTESEKALNGLKMKKKSPIDVEKQVFIALDVFNKNAFFVSVDDNQIPDPT